MTENFRFKLANSLIQRKRFIILFATAYLVLAIGQVIILHEIFEINWRIAILDSAVYNLILAGSGILISVILFYYKPASNSILIGVSIPIVITYIYAFKGSYILTWFLPENNPYFLFVEKSTPIRLFIGLLVNASVAAFSWLWYTIEEQSEVKNRQSKMEELAREAELLTLRQKIQPHFLFNSLNSISALAGSKPEEARKMIQQLSDFLRSTLRHEENSLTSIEDEILQLELYLSIEKVRFGHRLETTINISEESKKLLLPAMVIQPVVENAIKFGLYDTIEKVSIKINVWKEQNELIFEVENPFDPSTSMPEGTGFGLSSIKRRLYLLYTRNDLLHTKAQNKIYTTTIKIPQ